MNILVLCLGVGVILIGILHTLPPRLWAATTTALTRLAMILCLITGSGILAYDWLWNVTATAPRPGALWRASLPGFDFGLDVRPPTIWDAGSVEVWLYPYDADDIQPLLRLYGAPALQAPRYAAPVAEPPREVLPTPTPPLKQV